MSLPAVAKIGVGSTLAIGEPASIYLTWDHITLYAVERDVLKEGVNLASSNSTTPSDSVAGETYITTISYDNNKWSCIIRAKSSSENSSDLETNKDKFKKHIEARLPVSPTEGSQDKSIEKESNKKQLVLGCSKNRKFSDNGDLQTSLTVEVTKAENNFFLSLFGKKEQVNTNS